jgi:hypothetical protein
MLFIINALPAQMLQDCYNTDKQTGEYTQCSPTNKAELHAVKYNKKYLCGEVLFCAFFIMKGMATWSTVLPGKKKMCKESDTSYQIYKVVQI